MNLICPNCGKEVEHDIVSYKEIKGGTEYLVKCKNCGYTYTIVMKEDKMRDIKVIFSWKDKSEVKKYSTYEEDILHVGDEIRVDGINSLITALESKGRRVNKAQAKDVQTIWAKRFDEIFVKVSINRGERTLSHEITTDPDEEFYIGDILEINNFHAVIHKIKTKEQFIHRGGAAARDIVRIYAKEIREGRRKY